MLIYYMYHPWYWRKT